MIGRQSESHPRHLGNPQSDSFKRGHALLDGNDTDPVALLIVHDSEIRDGHKRCAFGDGGALNDGHRAPDLLGPICCLLYINRPMGAGAVPHISEWSSFFLRTTTTS